MSDNPRRKALLKDIHQGRLKYGKAYTELDKELEQKKLDWIKQHPAEKFDYSKLIKKKKKLMGSR